MKSKTFPLLISRYSILTIIVIGAFLIASCSIIDNITNLGAREKSGSKSMTIEEAMAVEIEDRRTTVLAEMGLPDAFSIRFDILEGEVVRWESWSYFDFGNCFEFLDGELLWTVELEPVPDSTLYAHLYSPFDFQPHTSKNEILAYFNGRPFEEISLSDQGIENGLLLIGDQIMLGFEQDKLVYVETLILEPDDVSGWMIPTLTPRADSVPTTSPLSTPGTTPSAQPNGAFSPRPNGAQLLFDGFDSSPALATAYYGDSFMAYQQVNGQGQLTTRFPYLNIFALYELPDMDDFIVEFDLMAGNLNEKDDAGIYFRGNTGDLSYYYALVVRPFDGEIGLKAYKDDEFVTWDFQKIPVGVLTDRGNDRIRLEVEGSNFTVFINGVYVTKFSDDQITFSGRFGLVMAADEAGESVLFDNLQLFRLP